MGNCIRHPSAGSWADEDDEWEWTEDAHRRRHLGGEDTAEEERELWVGKGEAALPPTTEVKIKIAKKKLEELLRKVETQGLPLHQALAHLVSSAAAGGGAALEGCRHWRPALHSIPEVSE